MSFLFKYLTDSFHISLKSSLRSPGIGFGDLAICDLEEKVSDIV